MAKGSGNSYVNKVGGNVSGASTVGLMKGATMNTITRKQAANLARSKSMGGKGG